LNFRVQKLKAALFRSAGDGTERPLGDVTFERFALVFALAKYDMSANIDLRFVASCPLFWCHSSGVPV
jgi:vacuolar protein sorting-associated protein 13A/C